MPGLTPTDLEGHRQIPKLELLPTPTDAEGFRQIQSLAILLVDLSLLNWKGVDGPATGIPMNGPGPTHAIPKGSGQLPKLEIPSAGQRTHH